MNIWMICWCVFLVACLLLLVAGGIVLRSPSEADRPAPEPPVKTDNSLNSEPSTINQFLATDETRI